METSALLMCRERGRQRAWLFLQQPAVRSTSDGALGPQENTAPAIAEGGNPGARSGKPAWGHPGHSPWTPEHLTPVAVICHVRQRAASGRSEEKKREGRDTSAQLSAGGRAGCGSARYSRSTRRPSHAGRSQVSHSTLMSGSTARSGSDTGGEKYTTLMQ